MSHYRAGLDCSDSGSQGARLGFLLGNSGVLAINAVLAHDLGDTEAAQATKSRIHNLSFR